MEQSFRYFNNLNDADTEMSDMDKLRQMIELKKRQQMGRENRVPKEMVMSFMTNENQFCNSPATIPSDLR